MLRGSTSDPERAGISATTRLADLGSCTDCQQGGLDYCNSVLAGILGQLQDRLQSILNAAARLVFSARRSECITPLLRELHWLRVPERVTFRLRAFWHTAVFMEQRRRTLLRACTGHLTSTLDVVCALLTRPCWWYRPPAWLSDIKPRSMPHS